MRASVVTLLLALSPCTLFGQSESSPAGSASLHLQVVVTPVVTAPVSLAKAADRSTELMIRPETQSVEVSHTTKVFSPSAEAPRAVLETTVVLPL